MIEVDDVRVEQESLLRECIKAEGVSVTKFATIVADKNYLVFGSFSVAEAFLGYLAHKRDGA